MSTGPNQPTTTTYGYDALRRLTQDDGPLGTGTRYGRGLNGELTTLEVVHPNWSLTYYDRNGFSELRQIMAPDVSTFN